jgi:hypothetical protein
MDWRRQARRALRDYPRLKKKQGMTDQQITPVYGGSPVQHEATRVTEDIALRSTLTETEANIISAVEFAMQMQGAYYNADARQKMIRLVYFKRTHTMQGAAMECGYSIETVWKWNTEVLAAVYAGLKK